MGDEYLDKIDEDNDSQNESFNMAVATLMRLDGILRRMEFTSQVTQGIPKQKAQLELLRHFFINASPLMAQKDPNGAKDYVEKVQRLKISSRMFKGKRYEIYNPKLDDDIMNLVTEIQIKLKGHFMPSGKSRDKF